MSNESAQTPDRREADLLAIVAKRERDYYKVVADNTAIRDAIEALLPWAFDDDLAVEVLQRGLVIDEAALRANGRLEPTVQEPPNLRDRIADAIVERWDAALSHTDTVRGTAYYLADAVLDVIRQAAS